MIFERKKYVSPQHGVALVSVMLLLAILVTLIAYMLESQYLVIRQTSLQSSDESSYIENFYAESWGLSMLIKSSDVSQAEKFEADFLTEPWAEEVLNYKADIVARSATIVDLQSRFNLNNLIQGKNKEWHVIFNNLLTILNVERNISDAIIDWIDSDNNPVSVNGAEDLDYLSELPSRRAANQKLQSVDELLSIKGITLDIYEALLPHVAVIDEEDVKININTATLEVLKAILPNGATSGSPEALIESRSDGFKSLDEILQLDELAGVGEGLNNVIDVKSSYFEVNSSIKFDETERQFKSGIKREIADEKITLSVIYRKREI